MDLENEPEIGSLLEDGPAPDWVRDVIAIAVAQEHKSAALWADEIAGALGRRANRLIRERLDQTGF